MRAALIAAVTYALCVMIAPIAVAADDGAPVPQGVAADNLATAAKHVHADGAVHHHADQGAPSDHDGRKGHATNCCGLLCLTALTVAIGVVFTHDMRASIALPAAAASRDGRGPDRLIRPPIAPLSL